MPDSRYILAAQDQKCPIKGRENFQIHFKWHGKPAIWENGNVYVLPAETLQKQQQARGWVQKLSELNK